MVDPKRSKVTADRKKNRLYITLSANADKKELEKIYTDVRFCVADLRPGFGVITDLSACTIGHLNGVAVFRKISAYLIANQAGEVVRVVGKMSVLFKQLVRIATTFQGYQPVYVDNLVQAEERFANAIKRKGLRFQVHQRLVDYNINEQDGKGFLVDISISGCAVQAPTVSLGINDIISLVIPLHQDNEHISSFRIMAKVVRVEEELFAAEFIDLDHEQQAHLYQCLACEALL
jgi:hypothetical protein